ncbi:MAG: LUD domain-containing protein [Rhodospirillaceae bacterium]|nr:LUD domain-containing protein [Rhodospirillaceae bacterium]MBT7957363.1 LUD domain-containing protein [Rhodospirillaceae bacterium]
MSVQNNTGADILGKIGAALDKDSDKAARAATAAARIESPPKNLIPNRAQVSPEDQVQLFRDWAEEVSATTDRIEHLDDLPAALAAYLSSQNLPSEIKSSDDPLLGRVDWTRQPTLTRHLGVAIEADQASLAVAFAGIAETGTLVLHAAPENPTTLNFLPETHIVVLPRSRVTGDYETTWNRLRNEIGSEPSSLPRVVNWITGPSRTGDIEQKIQLGIHGPRRLHIIIIDEA